MPRVVKALGLEDLDGRPGILCADLYDFGYGKWAGGHELVRPRDHRGVPLFLADRGARGANEHVQCLARSQEQTGRLAALTCDAFDGSEAALVGGELLDDGVGVADREEPVGHERRGFQLRFSRSLLPARPVPDD